MSNPLRYQRWINNYFDIGQDFLGQTTQIVTRVKEQVASVRMLSTMTKENAQTTAMYPMATLLSATVSQVYSAGDRKEVSSRRFLLFVYRRLCSDVLHFTGLFISLLVLSSLTIH